jgi:hypothetical protein
LRKKYIALECEKDRLEERLMGLRCGEGQVSKAVKDAEMSRMSKKLVHLRGLLMKCSE